MSHKIRYYAAFGSNMNLEDMKKRCPFASRIGVGEIADFEIVFRGEPPRVYATLTEKPGSVVPVVLWQITPSDESSLDEYEDFPHLYRKEEIAVRIDGASVVSMLYLMNGYEIAPPSDQYFNSILAGYLQNGLPAESLKLARKNADRHKEPPSNIY